MANHVPQAKAPDHHQSQKPQGWAAQQAAAVKAKEAAMEAVERCGTCRYFRRLPAGHVGRCQRFPPHQVYNDRAQVEPVDWCGEWEKGEHPHAAHERKVKEQIAKDQEKREEK